MPMPGLTWSSLKHHKSLIPLFASIVGGMSLSAFYVFRLATNSENVRWGGKHEGHAWERIKPNQQTKFYSPNIDYSKLTVPEDRPKF